MIIFMIISMVAGFLLANQNPINSDMRAVVRSPFIAATISFAIGTIFLAIISGVTSGQVLPSGEFISSHPAWIWLGGVFGAVYLTSNVLLFPKIGAIQTVILPVLGQIVMGTLIDFFGWFGTEKLPMTISKLVGIIVLVIGVLIAVVLPSLKNKDVRKFDSDTTNQESKPMLIGWQLWAIIAGFLSAMQQVINGHLGTLLGSPSQSSFISFGVGAILIAIVALVVDERVPTIIELKQARYWNWLGGFLGALFVFATVISVPKIGAGLTIMMGLIGQIFGSILIQQFGWWRSIKNRVVPAQIVGLVVMMIGVVLVKLG
ncbi:DMT family transporter [Lentilactobacillus sp. Marseille-Q4993]|uniref:DMT family transporter n=1 Tax=Lentilactobacillus sp. Marseille-Q4993 TaxID=3039492 RepID=UPI0024BC58DF|nr:DMT family transporter [Lentilactobacillus sp. Marseille-Q4993]